MALVCGSSYWGERDRLASLWSIKESSFPLTRLRTHDRQHGMTRWGLHLCHFLSYVVLGKKLLGVCFLIHKRAVLESLPVL